jgi:hypothetical protein
MDGESSFNALRIFIIIYSEYCLVDESNQLPINCSGGIPPDMVFCTWHPA